MLNCATQARQQYFFYLNIAHIEKRKERDAQPTNTPVFRLGRFIMRSKLNCVSGAPWAPAHAECCDGRRMIPNRPMSALAPALWVTRSS